ncbi:mRNA decay activator protein ZFP36L1-like [Heterodontus francisci]|uniref:mRNA decay activator protein ZFP36L1-like n=1 Tax=Heterodontus francisci TaxID=7792 RepID=UPI00355C973E
MSSLKELCDLVSGFSIMDPDDLSAFKPKLDYRAVRPPAGFRRHSTSFLPPSKSKSRPLTLTDSYWPTSLDQTDLRNLQKSLGLTRCLSDSDSLEDASKLAQQQQPSPRYKTELCRPFQENGVCRYGDKCQFAHGLGELRVLSRHPKYKTELCRTYHTSGFCPYGSRCHFIHNLEEERGSRPQPCCDRPRLKQSTSFSGFSSDYMGLQPSYGSALVSLSPPPSSDLPDWDLLRSAFSQEFARVMGMSCCTCHKHVPPVSQPVQAPHTDFPFTERSTYADSLSDQEDCSSSGSESPVFDPNRRLPIFSRISVSDD